MSEIIAPLSHQWLKTCEESNLILTFQGDFNQDLVNAILFLTEERQQLKESTTIIRNRVFGAMVELLQNICKHGEPLDSKDGSKPGIVLIGRTKNSFVISVGNITNKAAADKLSNSLNDLKKLSKDELHNKHKEVLATTRLSEKSGAGLGLIGMMRKSERLDYSFTPIDDGNIFFGVEVVISTIIK